MPILPLLCFQRLPAGGRTPVTCSTRSGVTCHPFCPCRRHGLPVYGDNLDLTAELELAAPHRQLVTQPIMLMVAVCVLAR